MHDWGRPQRSSPATWPQHHYGDRRTFAGNIVGRRGVPHRRSRRPFGTLSARTEAHAGSACPAGRSTETSAVRNEWPRIRGLRLRDARLCVRRGPHIVFLCIYRMSLHPACVIKLLNNVCRVASRRSCFSCGARSAVLQLLTDPDGDFTADRKPANAGTSPSVAAIARVLLRVDVVQRQRCGKNMPGLRVARAQQPTVQLVLLERQASLPGAVRLNGSVAQQVLIVGHASSAGRCRRGDQRPDDNRHGGQPRDDVIPHGRFPFICSAGATSCLTSVGDRFIGRQTASARYYWRTMDFRRRIRFR